MQAGWQGLWAGNSEHKWDSRDCRQALQSMGGLVGATTEQVLQSKIVNGDHMTATHSDIIIARMVSRYPDHNHVTMRMLQRPQFHKLVVSPSRSTLVYFSTVTH